MTFFTIEIPDSFTVRYKAHQFLQMKDGKVISKTNEVFHPSECAFNQQEIYDLIYNKLTKLLSNFKE